MPTARLPDATLLTVSVVPEIEPVNCGAGAPPKVVEGDWVMATPVIDFETSIAVRPPVSTKLDWSARRSAMVPVLVIEPTDPDWSMMAPTLPLVARRSGDRGGDGAGVDDAADIGAGGDDDGLHRLVRRGGDARADPTVVDDLRRGDAAEDVDPRRFGVQRSGGHRAGDVDAAGEVHRAPGRAQLDRGGGYRPRQGGRRLLVVDTAGVHRAADDQPEGVGGVVADGDRLALPADHHGRRGAELGDDGRRRGGGA